MAQYSHPSSFTYATVSSQPWTCALALILLLLAWITNSRLFFNYHPFSELSRLDEQSLWGAGDPLASIQASQSHAAHSEEFLSRHRAVQIRMGTHSCKLSEGDPLSLLWEANDVNDRQGGHFRNDYGLRHPFWVTWTYNQLESLLHITELYLMAEYTCEALSLTSQWWIHVPSWSLQHRTLFEHQQIILAIPTSSSITHKSTWTSCPSTHTASEAPGKHFLLLLDSDGQDILLQTHLFVKHRISCRWFDGEEQAAASAWV